MPDVKDDETVIQIKKDLKYFEDAHKQTGVGGAPPTVFAAKYAADVRYLLVKLGAIEDAPAEKTQLEMALDHDAARRSTAADRDAQ